MRLLPGWLLSKRNPSFLTLHRFEDLLLILEAMGFAGPARGTELDSQRSYSTGTLPRELASFERHTYQTVSGKLVEAVASRIYVNKTSHHDGAKQKVILRPLSPDATFFLCHLVRVFQPTLALFQATCAGVYRQITPENAASTKSRWMSGARTFRGRNPRQGCSVVWTRVMRSIQPECYLNFSEWRQFLC